MPPNMRPQGYRTERPCSIDGCERPHYARDWCHAHYERWRKYGSPDIVHPVGFAPGSDHPDWAGDDAGYWGVHARLRRERGPASDYSCNYCGADARDWSYQFGAPDEQIDPATGFPFTTDLSFYEPECRSCNLKRGARRGSVPLDAT